MSPGFRCHDGWLPQTWRLLVFGLTGLISPWVSWICNTSFTGSRSTQACWQSWLQWVSRSFLCAAWAVRIAPAGKRTICSAATGCKATLCDSPVKVSSVSLSACSGISEGQALRSADLVVGAPFFGDLRELRAGQLCDALSFPRRVNSDQSGADRDRARAC